MHAVVSPLTKHKKKKHEQTPKLNLLLQTCNINNEIILSRQSLPTSNHQHFLPAVDISEQFEKSLQNCVTKRQTYKPHMKIKAIENIPISKKLSENIIESYRKSQKEQINTNQRNRSASETTSPTNNPELILRNNRRASELVDQLLLEIYGRNNTGKLFETEYASSTSFRSTSDNKFDQKLQYGRLILKGIFIFVLYF